MSPSKKKTTKKPAEPTRKFKPGDRVMVAPEVIVPKYGWGDVGHGEVGTVCRYDAGGYLIIDFPNHIGWAGVESEVVLAPAETPAAEKAKSILLEAESIVNGPRAEAYGDPAENWGNTAAIASAITGKDLTAEDLILIMFAVKLARLRKSPDHRDSIVDLAGYAEVLSRIVGA